MIKDMKVRDLKNIIKDLDDDLTIVIPIISEEDVNAIYGFRKVRTAGILTGETEENKDVLCLNGATPGTKLDTQVAFSSKDVDVKDVLY